MLAFVLKAADAPAAGFEVVGLPVDYRSSGMRSFYVDETAVIRGGDNLGGPSSKPTTRCQRVQ
ncbi:MAG: hypothetical protein ABR594_17305 [Pyrinomonadaceae bacterium]